MTTETIKFDAQCFNRTYIPLLHNTSEFVHLVGGAGSGKSRFEAQKEIALSYDWQRRNRKTIVVRKVYNTLKDSCYSELKTVISEWGLDADFDISKSPLGIVNKKTGVEFLFKGFDDPEKIKSITGADRVWYEEATESSNFQELRQLRLRLRGFENVQITLSYNPINAYHYLNTEIHQAGLPEHFIHITTYRDNEKLLAIDPSYGEYIESTKHSDPNYYKVYGLGEWGQNSAGLIYPDYKVADEMPLVAFYGLDFGYNDPTALVECAVVDSPNEPVKRLYWSEVLYETGLTSDTLIARMNALGVSKSLVIICDNARPEMIADLRKAGFNAVPCTKYKGSVVEGINAVKGYSLHITAGSKNLFREIQNYSWLEKDGKFMDDTPKGGVDHLMDAGRYALESQNVIPLSASTFRM